MGTPASRAFLRRAWSAGMLAWQAGRVEHVGLVTSSTTSAVVRRSSVTGAGAGIAGATFGFADGDDEAVAATVAAAVVAGAMVGVGDGAAAGLVHPAARAIAAMAGRARRMRRGVSGPPVRTVRTMRGMSRPPI